MNPARLAAARTLVALDHGRTTLAAEVERERRDLADSRDRGLFLEIVAGTVRWRAALDACLAANSRRPVDDLSAEVRAVLRSGAYQLLHLDRVPAHAAVSESVDVVRALGQPRAASFVNAVLRSLTRRGTATTLPKRPASEQDRAAVLKYLSVALSHPVWLVERWLDRVGFDAAEQWCRFNNTSPAITLRPIPPSTVESLTGKLADAGITASPARFAPGALLLAPGALGQVPADLRDSFLIQDEGSQLVALAAGAEPGERVLDVCAAPGGKTLVLSGSVGDTGLVVAADFRPARVSLLKTQLQRAAVPAPIVALDATAPLPFGSVFDRVLLDAPCSGLGTLRRDPDLKWSRQPQDLQPLAAAQITMVMRAAEVVRAGGELIYATCSSEPEENESVIDAFLGSTVGFRLEPITAPAFPQLVNARGFLQTRPDRDDLDAFFAARLVRNDSGSRFSVHWTRQMPTSQRTTAVRTRMWTVGRFFVLVGALIATFFAFFLAGLRVTTRAREVQVPDLAAKSVTEARSLLADRGLELRVDEQRRADKAVPVDHVLSQDPAPGEVVRRQRAVRVRLSDGQRAPVLPAVVDLPERTAEITLSGEHVEIGYRAEIRSTDYAPGAVVAQDPAAPQRSSLVNLLVNRSDGSQVFVVPDLIGTLGSKAVDVLRGLNFRIAVTSEVPYPGLPPGIVVKQTPQPGFRIASGETITLEISR